METMADPRAFLDTKGNWGGEVQEDDHTAKNMIIIIRI